MKLLLKTLISICCLVLVAAASWWILKRRRREYTDDERFLAWLTGILPFAYGGYYSISAAAVGVILLCRLVKVCRRQHGLRIYRNLPALGLAAVVAGYCVSVCWAVNRGMALYGIAKHMPLIMYALLLMQNRTGNPETGETEPVTDRILTLLPFSGSVMVLLAPALQFVPGFGESQVIDGRLAGFFEYPNTLALFLMLGIAVAALGRESSRWKFPELAVLTAGVFGTGSRIGFALLTVEFTILCLMLRKRRQVLLMAGIFACGLGLSLLLGRLESLTALSRYTTTTEETSSLLTRLLYYRDALPVILRHPFGLGYWGYASAHKLFQHGVYSVVHVHNDLLQLLLDIGWIPAGLMCAGLAVSFFGRKTCGIQRLLIFLIAAYCMFEFHLAYLSIWLTLTTCLRLRDGTCVTLRLPRAGSAACITAAGCVLAMSVWLGAGEALSTAGYRETAVTLTPVYTPALSKLLSETEDIMLKKQYAQKLSALDPCSAAAWQALAEAAWNDGQQEKAVSLQERAISCAPYRLERYLKYFELLDTMLQQAEAAGDTQQADACREKLLAIPELLQTVLDTTDPVAWKIQHKPELTLPETYQQRLEALRDG